MAETSFGGPRGTEQMRDKLGVWKGKENPINTTGSLLCWRRKGQPTPVFLPGKFHGQRSLQATGHGVTKSRTWLSDFTFSFPFSASIWNRQRNLPSAWARSRRLLHFFFWERFFSFIPSWIPVATPSVYHQHGAALLWMAAGRLLSQCRHWERQKPETNDFSSTNIFSFLLLKLDGRPHGEVKRTTFSSKESCSLPGGRS